MWLPKGSYGTRSMRIKKFTVHTLPCKSCRAFDTKVEVYQDYYHFLFIPFFAKSDKVTRIRCNNCGEPVLTASILKEYADQTKTPFYLFSGVILIALFTATIFINTFLQQQDTENFAAHPQVGDVYRVKNAKSNSYYFLKLKNIHGDTLSFYQNSFIYYRAVDALNNKADYFYPGETILFTKNDIQQKLTQDEIDVVYRNYSNSTGFER